MIQQHITEAESLHARKKTGISAFPLRLHALLLLGYRLK
nr:MAG TPA_asm: hypothetical protein [Caudoviricetes sp.]